MPTGSFGSLPGSPWVTLVPLIVITPAAYCMID
jgi:hypothetical protein